MALRDAPATWFQVGLSSEFRRGRGVRRVMRWGEELVAYRSASGRLVVHNAICPHLGAHLGGGTVRGECLECPFHGWQYHPDGVVQYVPGARRVPSRARLDSYPTFEVGGIAFMYPRPADAGAAPRGLDPDLERALRDDRHVGSFTTILVQADIDDIQENAADTAHFAMVHRTSIARTRPFRSSVDDECHFLVEGVLEAQLGGDITVELRCFDPCTAYTVSRSRWGNSELFVFLAQLGPRETELHFLVRTAPHFLIGRLLNRVRANKQVEVFCEDRAVWAERTRLDTPILSDADGPVLPYRRWIGAWTARYGHRTDQGADVVGRARAGPGDAP